MLMTSRLYCRRRGVLTQRIPAIKGFPSIVGAFEAGALGSINGSEPVLMIGRLGKIYKLNLSAAIIWDILTEPSSLEKAASALARVYTVLPDEAMAATETLVRYLLEEGLLDCESEAAITGTLKI